MKLGAMVRALEVAHVEIDVIKLAVKRDLVKELCKRAAGGEELSLDFLTSCVSARDAIAFLQGGIGRPGR